MKKRGISAIVATVLIILITVAAVTILWSFIIPMVQDSLQLATMCNAAKPSIDFSSGYTCYDSESNAIGILVRKDAGGSAFSGVEFTFSDGGRTRVMGRDFVGGENEKRRFFFVLDNKSGEVSIAPIVTDGNTEKVCDIIFSTSEIGNCTINNGSSNIEDDYVGYWKFDGDASDVTSRMNGTIHDDTHYVVGRNGIGSGLSFDGSGDHVRAGGQIGISDKNFTVSHWIRTTQSNSQIYTVANTGHGDGFRFGIHTTGGQSGISFLIGDNFDSIPGLYTEEVCLSNININDGEWHMISGTYRRGDVFRCYVDGKFQNEIPILDFYYGNKDDNLRFGAPHCCNDLNGEMDEVVIYNRVLDDREIRQLYDFTKN
jgi:flagellin-like protein